MKITCPECTHDFAVEIAARFPDEQTLTFNVTPGEKGELSLATVGALMRDMHRLFLAVAKAENGHKFTTAIKGLSKLDDGTVSIEFTLYRLMEVA